MTQTANSPTRVLTIGSAMIDTIAVIDDELIERMSMNNADRSFLLLEEGTKTEAAVISTHAGGGAVNAAVCFARLGLDTACLVKLGHDARASAVRQALTSEGVSTDYVVDTVAASTGASVLVSSHDRNSAIFTFRGANLLLTPEDIPADAYAGRHIVHMASLSGHSADLLPELIARAAEAGAFISVNPGIRQLSTRASALLAVLPRIGVLAMNRAEAAALVPTLSEQQPRSSLRAHEAERVVPSASTELMHRGFSMSGYQMSLVHMVEALTGLGVGSVLVTDGRYGAYAGTREAIVHCPPVATEVLGTAGAGDAFTATFGAFRASGRPIHEGLALAATNAGSVVRHADTHTGLMHRAELEEAAVGHAESATTWLLESRG
jgi:ribokinase